MPKRILIRRVAALVVFATATQAHADAWYVFAGVGPSYTEDINGSVGGTPLRESYGTGFMVHGGSGYEAGPYRLEGEIIYAEHPPEGVTLGDIQSSSAGDRSALAGLANFYFDFDTRTRWVPYAGAGIGAAHIALNNIVASPSLSLDESDVVFAFQLKAGVAYSLSRSTRISVGYRFFGADEPKLGDVDGLAVKTEASHLHTLEAQVRYRF